MFVASLLHVEKFRWGEPHAMMSFSTSLSVPFFFHYEHNTRYVHLVLAPGQQLIKSGAMGIDLSSSDSFMQSLGSYASCVSVDSDTEECRYVWDVNGHDLTYAWKYAVERLREFCVLRCVESQNACVANSITIDTWLTPMPVWLGCLFQRFPSWSSLLAHFEWWEMCCLKALCEVIGASQFEGHFGSSMRSAVEGFRLALEA